MINKSFLGPSIKNLMVYVAAGIDNGQFVPTGEYKTTRVEGMGAPDVPQDCAPAAKRIDGASSKVLSRSERSRSSTKHTALQRGPMWQCRQIEVLLATILNLSIYSSLLQEMGGTVCDGDLYPPCLTSARATFVSRQVQMNYCSM